MRSNCKWIVALMACLVPLLSVAAWEVDYPRNGVMVLRNDNNCWGGINTRGLLPMGMSSIVVRKTFALNQLPAEALTRTRTAILRVQLGIVDGSMDSAKPNGLTEKFEVNINGHALVCDMNDARFKGQTDKKQPRCHDWIDLPFPREWLPRNKLVVTVRKLALGPYHDDHLYLGIDTSMPTVNSEVSFDGGKTWNKKWHDTNGTGEFMMRLILLDLPDAAQAQWNLATNDLTDPEGLWGYRNRDDGNAVRVEFTPGHWDDRKPLLVIAEFSGAPLRLLFTDAAGNELQPKIQMNGTRVTAEFGTGVLPFALETGKNLRLLTAKFAPAEKFPAPPVEQCPTVASSQGKRTVTSASCRVNDDFAILENAALKVKFRLRPQLVIQELYCAEIAQNILTDEQSSRLFRLRVNGKVWNARDAIVQQVAPLPNGFKAVLFLSEPQLECIYSVVAEADELLFNLEVVNRGTVPVEFMTAFPHLGGLRLSARSADDYYLFPWGGGLISNMPCHRRAAYGANDAWWQMVDIFSVTQGGGIYLRCDDPLGLYKFFNLRKGKIAEKDFIRTLAIPWPGKLDTKMYWCDALAPDDGIGLAIDYVKRVRGPGAGFKLPAARIGTHAGDWKSALARYAAWSKQVWPRRPWPSALTPKWNLRAGYGLGSPLLRKNDDYGDYVGLKERKGQSPGEILELCGWWTVSNNGPFETPLAQDSVLGPKYWRGPRCFDPATGRLIYTYNLGDYNTYNPQWGGLSALRKHIERIRKAQQLPIFYYDAVIIEGGTKAASELTPKYLVVNKDWKNPLPTSRDPVTPAGVVLNYMKYCMCLDNAEYSRYTAENVAKICKETGIDGIRMDEFGGDGYICFNRMHSHRFAEWGHNEWLRATAETLREIHAEMDKIRPGLVLLTEFPGHDMFSSYLEGAITYDTQNRMNRTRPAPINLFRFYFPECKLFELDETAETGKKGPMWNYWLWNAVGVYNSGVYPEAIRRILNENNDAFAFGQAEPLLPGFPPQVYANGFSSPHKRLWTLLNVNPVSAITTLSDSRVDRHYVELISGTELSPVKGKIELPVRPKRTAVIAEFPRLITFSNGQAVVAAMPAGATLTETQDGKFVKLISNKGILLDLRATGNETKRESR